MTFEEQLDRLMLSRELGPEELSALPADRYKLIDIRDEYSFQYGHIPGAVNLPLDRLEKEAAHFSPDKLLLLCCKSGQLSRNAAEKLR